MEHRDHSANSINGHHLVVGAGPVGSTTAQLLAEHGTPVTVLTRSGSGPSHPNITLARGSVTDIDGLRDLASGAAAIYNCVNPPYHQWPTAWPPMHQALMTAAEQSGAVLVMMDNLYAFGPQSPMPMHETDQLLATGPKGSTRAAMATELLAAHHAGRLRATLARASDFFGPGVKGAMLGERVVPKIIRGKKISILGALDVAHHNTYMPDVARTLVTIATDQRAWGKAWHVPSSATGTQRENIQALAHAAGTSPTIGTTPWAAVKAIGLVVPQLRELAEIRYQFDRPWIVDSTLTEDTFGLTATPIEQAALATVEWWRARQ